MHPCGGAKRGFVGVGRNKLLDDAGGEFNCVMESFG